MSTNTPASTRTSSHASARQRRGQHAARQVGTTAIELLIVLAIVGILLGGAVPTFRHMLSVNRAATVTNDLVHALTLTRAEALKRGHRVYLAPLTGVWHDGWAVFVDRDDDRVFDPSVDELIFRHDALPASVTITGTSSPARQPFTDVGSPRRTYAMFDGAGYPRQRNGGLGIGSFIVTDRTGGLVTVRTICVAAYGRIRIVANQAGC